MTEMSWLNEPPAWRLENGVLVATAGARTDYWQATKYGIFRDNGHVYGRTVSGDAVAEVVVRGAYATQYDQAGLGLRCDETHWIKCGVELVDGVPQVAVVVTGERSDWSIIPLTSDFSALWLRLVREEEAVEVFWSLDGETFHLFRLAPFPAGPALLGAMLAAPEGEGFEARFEGLSIVDGVD